MTPDSDSPLSPRLILRDISASWRTLVLTDIAFKVVAFILLTPLVTLLFRSLIALAGNAVLSDQDIVLFFLGPAGWVCGLLVGAIALAIAALGQCSLMSIVFASSSTNEQLCVIGALRFAIGHAWPVIQLAARVVLRTALAAAPFLGALAAVYFTLLKEYDINYYLKEKPPAFIASLAIGGIIGAAMVAVLLWLFTGWVFALPLVVFENVRPRAALRLSRERVRGRRRTLLLWIGGFFLAVFIVSSLATAIVGWLGRLIVPQSTASLRLLALAIGATLLVWAAVNLAVNLLGDTAFAALLFRLYWHYARSADAPTSPHAVSTQITTPRGVRLTRWRLLASGAVGAVAALLIGAIVVSRMKVDDGRVLIMAHRGASKAAPENTLAAFRKAIDDRADWIELDVQETADGQVVVFHDSDFMKLSNVNLKIWDATMDRLRDIDIGGWMSPAFKDQRVPTLAEVLDTCRGKIRVDIELKYYGHDQQLEQRVADIVDSHDMASQIMAMSLKADAVRKMKSIRPQWKVGQLMSVYAGDLKKLDADFLAVNASFVNRRFIRAAHANGKQVYVWTVNDAATMSRMIGCGVDGLLTDKPELARSVIEQRAGMTTPQRLLLELAAILGVTPQIDEQ
jgi:glycerophosphoryl diester phosphodiesterase